MKKLLALLDGSPLSETALPLVVALAGGGRCRVTLLSVWETEPAEMVRLGDEHARALREHGLSYFRAYLEGVAEGLAGKGVDAEIDVRAGHPAAEILSAAGELKPDMIVMASRGRGAAESGRGSVADKVLRGSTVPVLILGPRLLEAEAPIEGSIESILVPLDGNPESESALDFAADLAREIGARISLLEVVPPLLRDASLELADSYPPELEERREREALRYLKGVQGRFPDLIDEVYMETGLPRQEIARFVEKRGVDLVVMASRSRYSHGLWTLGGVADAAIEGSAPVVLVPPLGAQPR